MQNEKFDNPKPDVKLVWFRFSQHLFVLTTTIMAQTFVSSFANVWQTFIDERFGGFYNQRNCETKQWESQRIIFIDCGSDGREGFQLMAWGSGWWWWPPGPELVTNHPEPEPEEGQQSRDGDNLMLSYGGEEEGGHLSRFTARSLSGEKSSKQRKLWV